MISSINLVLLVPSFEQLFLADIFLLKQKTPFKMSSHWWIEYMKYMIQHEARFKQGISFRTQNAFYGSICTEKKVKVVNKGTELCYLFHEKWNLELNICWCLRGIEQEIEIVIRKNGLHEENEFLLVCLSWVNQRRWGNWNDFVNTWNYATRRTLLQHTWHAVYKMNSLNELFRV